MSQAGTRPGLGLRPLPISGLQRKRARRQWNRQLLLRSKNRRLRFSQRNNQVSTVKVEVSRSPGTLSRLNEGFGSI